MDETLHCGCCQTLLPNLKAFVAHYRKEHPEDGERCYDQCGTVGDKFADAAIAALWKHRAEWMNASARDKDREAIVARHNRLARAMQIIATAVDLAA